MRTDIQLSIDRLNNIFEDGIEKYVDPITNLTYDYYVPSTNLYIDMRYGIEWQGHSFDSYNRIDIELAEWLKEKGTDNAPYKWVTEGSAKDNVAKMYNRSYIIFWSIEELNAFFDMSMKLEYSNDDMRIEYEKILKHDGKLSLYSGHNKIVKQFQQENLYQPEQALFDDYAKRYKLCRNRDKYLGLKIWDLNANDMINGFKIAGMHYGFSMFSPMIGKWFVWHFNLQDSVCYDPTGGWGHRLLGIAPFVKKYIYNDLSPHTVESCKRIAQWANLDNVEYHNEDATTFMPDADYDFMFTCPPYYADDKNTEEYECDGFTSLEQFNDFLLGMYDKFLKKESCKYFGLVIREDMVPDIMRKDIKESYCVARNSNSHYARTSKLQRKKFLEYLYIFKKDGIK